MIKALADSILSRLLIAPARAEMLADDVESWVSGHARMVGADEVAWATAKAIEAALVAIEHGEPSPLSERQVEQLQAMAVAARVASALHFMCGLSIDEVADATHRTAAEVVQLIEMVPKSTPDPPPVLPPITMSVAPPVAPLPVQPQAPPPYVPPAVPPYVPAAVPRVRSCCRSLSAPVRSCCRSSGRSPAGGCAADSRSRSDDGRAGTPASRAPAPAARPSGSPSCGLRSETDVRVRRQTARVSDHGAHPERALAPPVAPPARDRWRPVGRRLSIVIVIVVALVAAGVTWSKTRTRVTTDPEGRDCGHRLRGHRGQTAPISRM